VKARRNFRGTVLPKELQQGMEDIGMEVGFETAGPGVRSNKEILPLLTKGLLIGWGGDRGKGFRKKPLGGKGALWRC